MKKILLIGLFLVVGLSAFGQRRISPAKQIYLAPDTAYILLSDGAGELQFVLLNDAIPPGSGGGADQDTLINVGDGRYYFIDEGDTTIINTQADTNPITTNITVGDSIYQAANSSVQDLIIALAAISDSTFYKMDGQIKPDGDNTRNVDLNGQRVSFEDTGQGFVSIQSIRDQGIFSIKKTGDADSLVVKFDYGVGGDYGLFLDGASGQRDIFSVTGTSMSMGNGFTNLRIESTLPDDNSLNKVLAVDPVTEQVKQVSIASLGGTNASPCQDTISQSAHGFSLGDLVGQTSGDYFAANTANADSLPVAFVCSVIDANSFTIGTEGWVDWTHGQTADADYFLQDNGTLGTSPDADYTVFGFRTFGSDKAAFDIPELVVDGSAGGGGSSPNVTASNGLNDQDVSTDIDVELGGTLDKNTTVETEGFNLLVGDNTGNDKSYIRTSSGNAVDLFASDATTNNESNVTVTETGTVISTDQGGATTFTQLDVSGQSFSSTVSTSGVTQTQLVQNTTTFALIGIPAYADEAAATTAGLTTGSLYQTTGTAAAPLNVAGILMVKQ